MAEWLDLETIAVGVFAHAEEHYNEGGWDVLVECMTVDDLIDSWVRQGYRPRTVNGAVAHEASGAVAVWADRQADAVNSAF